MLQNKITLGERYQSSVYGFVVEIIKVCDDVHGDVKLVQRGELNKDNYPLGLVWSGIYFGYGSSFILLSGQELPNQ
jgi:hypothetical protein